MTTVDDDDFLLLGFFFGLLSAVVVDDDCFLVAAAVAPPPPMPNMLNVGDFFRGDVGTAAAAAFFPVEGCFGELFLEVPNRDIVGERVRPLFATTGDGLTCFFLGC